MIELIAVLISGIFGATGSIFAYMKARQFSAANREKHTLEIRMAEIEAQRERTRGDDEAMKSMLAIMSTFVQSLPGLQDSIRNLVKVTEKQAGIITGLAQTTGTMALTSQEVLERAERMHQVVERRDQEAQQDREAHDNRHQEITTRLDKQGDMLEKLITDIKAAAIPDAIRGDITLLVSLATGIQQDVKLLLKDTDTDTPPPGPGAPISVPKPEPADAQQETDDSEETALPDAA